jgi:predicted metal-binding membrane protein
MQARAQQPLPLGFLFGCATVFAIAVAGTVYFCRSMSGGMDMPGGWTMSMMWMPMPGCTWAASAAMFLLAWFLMMVAMMLPSALPMLLNVRGSLRKNKGDHFDTLAMFAAAGYFFVWTLIGAVVYALGVAYALETMRLDWLSRLTPVLSGIMLIVTGIIQFSSWKMSALRRCRAPDCGTLPDAGATSGWRYGFKQGMACGVCCAAPMLALLVLGAMNPVVMVLITAVITAEKLLPFPERTVRLFGVVVVLAGMGIVARTLLLR